MRRQLALRWTSTRARRGSGFQCCLREHPMFSKTHAHDSESQLQITRLLQATAYVAIKSSQTNKPIGLARAFTITHDYREARGDKNHSRHNAGQTSTQAIEGGRSERVPQNPTPPHKSYPQIACMHHRSEKAQVCKRKRDDLRYRAGEHATPSWHDTQTLEIHRSLETLLHSRRGEIELPRGQRLAVVGRADEIIRERRSEREGFKKKSVMMKSVLLTSSFQVVSPAGRSVWG
jgi:hypothetical protein